MFLGAMVWAAPGRAAAGAGGSARQAAKLAGGIAKARTAAAGERSVLAVVKALGWPVVTQSGHVVSDGASNIPPGFALYDFELVGVAHGMSAGTTLSLDDLAATVTKDSVRRNNKPVTATALRAALIAAVGEAVHKPSAPGSLPGLLVRDLGQPA
jgi:hypothetical protein